MIAAQDVRYCTGRPALLISLLLCAFFIASCCPGIKSPDGTYTARIVGGGNHTNYDVVETETCDSAPPIFTTHAQYENPNVVKAGQFSRDSKMFAAAYHYSHDGDYTWIGVWSTETGEFLYSRTVNYWTTYLDNAFDN